MPWVLVFARRAERDLEALDQATRVAIMDRIRAAAIDPGSVDLSKLRGRPGEWRIRVGSWRVILELDSRAGRMTVTRILARRDAYR
jgi:mRNA interferase RelE/StbE